MKKLQQHFWRFLFRFKAMRYYFEETVATCAMCDSLDIGEVRAGDEGWTVCQDCGSIEQGYTYLTEYQAEKKGLIG